MRATDEINYADDFRYNEMLHSIAQSIMHIYIRLRRCNPGHPNEKAWDENIKYWSRYDREEIRGMALPTEEQAKAELAKVTKAYKEAERLLNTLNNL